MRMRIEFMHPSVSPKASAMTSAGIQHYAMWYYFHVGQSNRSLPVPINSPSDRNANRNKAPEPKDQIRQEGRRIKIEETGLPGLKQSGPARMHGRSAEALCAACKAGVMHLVRLIHMLKKTWADCKLQRVKGMLEWTSSGNSRTLSPYSDSIPLRVRRSG